MGQTINRDSLYLGSGILIRRAVNKYGILNFKREVLEYCFDKETLNKREIYWIDQLDCRNPNIGYNQAVGGTGGPNMLGKKLTEEAKRKISLAHKGKSKSPEHIKNLSISHKNSSKNRKPGQFQHSQETKEKIAQTLIERADRLGRKQITEKLPRKVKIYSLETAVRISENMKNAPKLQCPHCGVVMKIPNVYQYHFNRCKLKEGKDV